MVSYLRLTNYLHGMNVDVLILVVVDDGLVPLTALLASKEKGVLILVVVDDGLVRLDGERVVNVTRMS